MLTNIARGSENTAAQRLSPWRKGTRRRDRRATSPESARARARADAASAQPQSEARAKGRHERRVAPSRGARFMKPHPLQKRSARVLPRYSARPRSAAFCRLGRAVVNCGEQPFRTPHPLHVYRYSWRAPARTQYVLIRHLDIRKSLFSEAWGTGGGWWGGGYILVCARGELRIHKLRPR